MGGFMTIKTYYTCTVIKTIEQDNYNEGCIGGTFQDLGVITEFKEDDLKQIIIDLKQLYSVDPCIFDGENNRVEIQMTENEYGDKASKKELEQWGRGSINLWVATYSCYIEKIISNDDLLDELKTLNLKTI
jgi:hypothetical protein